MTLRIPEEKMKEIQKILHEWENKCSASKRETQQLVGLLNFTVGCVWPGHIYFSGILNFLCSFKEKAQPVVEEVKRDVHWWRVCAQAFNGVSLILNVETKAPGETVQTDACLSGAGACTKQEFFHLQFPEQFLAKCSDINQRECMTILVAVRLWGHAWSRRRIVIECDNWNSVLAINLGNSRDPMMQSILRNLHLESSLKSLEIRAVFVFGRTNT